MFCPKCRKIFPKKRFLCTTIITCFLYFVSSGALLSAEQHLDGGGLDARVPVRLRSSGLPWPHLRQRRLRPGEGHPEHSGVLRPGHRPLVPPTRHEEDVRLCRRCPHRPAGTFRGRTGLIEDRLMTFLI